MHAGGTPPRLGNVDPNSTRMEAIGFFLHTVSTTDPLHQMTWSHLQWRSPCGFIYRSKTKAGLIRTHCQTRWRCPSKPDPSDLLRISRWCAAISRLKACSRSTSHHLDSSDLPGHWNTGGRCSGAGVGQTVLATNRNGGMLRLNATRDDDDDDDGMMMMHYVS